MLPPASPVSPEYVRPDHGTGPPRAGGDDDDRLARIICWVLGPGTMLALSSAGRHNGSGMLSPCSIPPAHIRALLPVHRRSLKTDGLSRSSSAWACDSEYAHPHRLTLPGLSLVSGLWSLVVAMLLNKALRALLPIVALVTPTFAAFGITTSGSSWTVDTNAGLVFTGAFA